MEIPETCQKDHYPYLCTYLYFMHLGYTPQKADTITLFLFGHIQEIYT